MRLAALITLGTSFALSLGAVAHAQPAGAQPPSGNVAAADAKIESAKLHYSRGEMSAALADLSDAYRLDPRPEILYAIAIDEDKLGDCAGALAHFKQYLDTNPAARARAAAEKAMEPCQQKLGVGATSTPPTTGTSSDAAKPADKPATAIPAATTGTGSTSASQTVVVSRPVYKDGLGDGLAIGGVVAGASGLALYLIARKDINDSASAPTLQAHDDDVTRAQNLRTYAVVAGGIGGALAIGAVIRWATHGGGTETREAHDRVDVTLVPSPDGTGWGLAAVGRF